LADERKRYLRQQAELGGREVYLDQPVAESRAAEAPGAAAGGRVAELPNPVTAEGRAADSPSHEKWRKDAPPIPGPGFTIAPPDPGLLGDTIYQLESLERIAETVRGCTRCRLCDGRMNAVPGEGNPAAGLMCVGEGPGQTEDQTGRPFVGRAGELLTQILAAIDLPRERVFIANIVKCRPPENRKPLPDEAAACIPYLHQQIALIRPKVLLALGATAAEGLLGMRKSLGELRGKVHRYGSTPLIVTYHPAALLRNPHWKKPTWDDVRIARQLLDQG
jgi:uracil-DNA glycosylase